MKERKEAEKSISNFVDKIVKNSKPLDPKIQKAINKDFWDLI
jgi:transcription termination factor NusB